MTIEYVWWKYEWTQGPFFVQLICWCLWKSVHDVRLQAVQFRSHLTLVFCCLRSRFIWKIGLGGEDVANGALKPYHLLMSLRCYVLVYKL